MAPQLVTRKSDFFRVWKKFVERGVSDNVPETIRNSWLRSRNAGLNPLDNERSIIRDISACY